MTQLGFYYDMTICTGCKTCMLACKDYKNLDASVSFRQVYEVAGGDWSQSANGCWTQDCFAYYVSSACNHCSNPACMEVCPTGAIDAVDAWAPDQGRIGCAILHEDRCLAFLETNSCGICVDACPYEALSFDAGRRPVVDETACNGCGECVKICPANVFTSFSGGKARGIEVVTETTFRARSDA